MMILRAADVVVAPALSRATAVTENDPAGALLHVAVYGLVVSEPMSVEPAMKSTRAMVPFVSAALAATVTDAGAM